VCLLALHYLSPALEPWIAVAAWQSAVNQWLLAAAALLFSALREYIRKRSPWSAPKSRSAVSSCSGQPLLSS